MIMTPRFGKQQSSQNVITPLQVHCARAAFFHMRR